MGFKDNVVKTGRDIYFNSQGSANADGASIENAVDDPSTAITRINALSPAPSAVAPASINAAETGFFTTAITVPDFVSARAKIAGLLDSVSTLAIAAGSSQLQEWGVLSNTVTNGKVVSIVAKNALAVNVTQMIVGSDTVGGGNGTTGNIGYDVSGACDDIFINNLLTEIRGDGAIGVSHTASFTTPARYTFDVVEFFGPNQTVFKMDAPNDFDQAQITLISTTESSVAVNPTTASTIFDIPKGTVNVVSNALSADVIADVGILGRLGLRTSFASGDMTVQSGGSAAIVALRWTSGTITVDSGGELNCIIHLFNGTLVNNGTINGIINGECYGTWCDHKHREESLGAVATSGSVEKFTVDVALDAGDYEYTLAFDYLGSATNVSCQVDLLKDAVIEGDSFLKRVTTTGDLSSVTKTYPRDTLTAATYTFSVDVTRVGGGVGATVTAQNVILKIRKLPPEL